MKTKKKLLIVMLSLLFTVCLVFAGCNEDKNPIVSVTVKTQPFIVDYNLGDAIDFTDAVLTVTFKDGTTQDVQVTSQMYTAPNLTQEGDQAVEISYEGNKVSITIHVTKSRAQKLADAKTKAKGDLDTYLATFSGSQYDSADWTSMQQVVTDAKTSIESATSEAACLTLFNNAKASLDGFVKTADKPAALVSKKAKYVASLYQYTKSDFSTQAQYDNYVTVRNNAKTAIEAVAEYNDIDSVYAAQIALVNGVEGNICTKILANDFADLDASFTDVNGDNATIVNKTPEGLTGRAFNLEESILNYQMLSTVVNLSNGVSNEAWFNGEALFTMWVYINNINVFDDSKITLYLFWSDHTDWATAKFGRYLFDTNLINTANGFVTGWNRIAIPFDALLSGFYLNKNTNNEEIPTTNGITYLNIGLRNTTEGHPNNIPVIYGDTQFLVCDIAYIAGDQTETIKVIETQPETQVAKATAIEMAGSLNTYATQSDYYTFDWENIQSMITKSYNKIIYELKTVDEINTEIANCKSKIDTVVKIADDPNKLVNVKKDYSNILDNKIKGLNKVEFTEERWTALLSAVDTAKTAISNATSVEDAATIYATQVAIVNNAALRDVQIITLVGGTWFYAHETDYWAVQGGKVVTLLTDIEGNNTAAPVSQPGTIGMYACIDYQSAGFTIDEFKNRNGAFTFWLYINDIYYTNKLSVYVRFTNDDFIIENLTRDNIIGQYDKSTFKLTSENGFVSGWNKVAINASEFNLLSGNCKNMVIGVMYDGINNDNTPAPIAELSKLSLKICSPVIDYNISNVATIKVVDTKTTKQYTDKLVAIHNAEVELNSYVTRSNYSATGWAQVQQIIKDCIDGLYELSDADEVAGPVAFAKTGIDAVAVITLDELKVECKDSLDAYISTLVTADYSQEKWTAINTAVSGYKGQIENCETKEAVRAKLEEVLESVKVDIGYFCITSTGEYKGTANGYDIVVNSHKQMSDVPEKIAGDVYYLNSEATNWYFESINYVRNSSISNADFIDGKCVVTFWLYIEDVELASKYANMAVKFEMSTGTTFSTVIDCGKYEWGILVHKDHGFISGWNKVAVVYKGSPYQTGVEGDFKTLVIGLTVNKDAMGDKTQYDPYIADLAKVDFAIADVRFDYTMDNELAGVIEVKKVIDTASAIQIDRKAAISKLNSISTLYTYKAGTTSNVETAITNGITAINACTTVEEINSALATAQANVTQYAEYAVITSTGEYKGTGADGWSIVANTHTQATDVPTQIVGDAYLLNSESTNYFNRSINYVRTKGISTADFVDGKCVLSFWVYVDDVDAISKNANVNIKITFGTNSGASSICDVAYIEAGILIHKDHGFISGWNKVVVKYQPSPYWISIKNGVASVTAKSDFVEMTVGLSIYQPDDAEKARIGAVDVAFADFRFDYTLTDTVPLANQVKKVVETAIGADAAKVAAIATLNGLKTKYELLTDDTSVTAINNIISTATASINSATTQEEMDGFIATAEAEIKKYQARVTITEDGAYKGSATDGCSMVTITNEKVSSVPSQVSGDVYYLDSSKSANWYYNSINYVRNSSISNADFIDGKCVLTFWIYFEDIDVASKYANVRVQFQLTSNTTFSSEIDCGTYGAGCLVHKNHGFVSGWNKVAIVYTGSPYQAGVKGDFKTIVIGLTILQGEMSSADYNAYKAELDAVDIAIGDVKFDYTMDNTITGVIEAKKVLSVLPVDLDGMVVGYYNVHPDAGWTASATPATRDASLNNSVVLGKPTCNAGALASIILWTQSNVYNSAFATDSFNNNTTTISYKLYISDISKASGLKVKLTFADNITNITTILGGYETPELTAENGFKTGWNTITIKASAFNLTSGSIQALVFDVTGSSLDNELVLRLYDAGINYSTTQADNIVIA